jgi:hypothetical protein
MAKITGAVIYNESAYNAATHSYILQNARTTFCRTYPDAEAIIDWCVSFKTYDEGGYFVGYKDGFGGSLAKALDSYGKLTEGQVNAVRKILADRAARKAEWADKEAAINANRQHLGEVGKKVTLVLTVKHIVYIDGVYGTTCIHICEDANQNVVIYKGNASGFPDKGETATIVATVKEHGVRNGVKQTVIQRPKLVA